MGKSMAAHQRFDVVYVPPQDIPESTEAERGVGEREGGGGRERERESRQSITAFNSTPSLKLPKPVPCSKYLSVPTTNNPVH